MSTSKLKDFLDLIKKQFSNKSSLIEEETAPYYAVGNKLGFPNELLDLYIESVISSNNEYIEIPSEINNHDESVLDKIIEGDSHLDQKDVEYLSQINKKTSPFNLEDLIIEDKISNKSKYLLAFWNKYYSAFAVNNNALNETLINHFELGESEKVPFFKVFDLFEQDKRGLEKIINTPNGVGRSKVLELKKLLVFVIQESAKVDSYVNQAGIEKVIIDFLFKIDSINEENIDYLKAYKSKPIYNSAPYPIFWLFNLYLKSISKSNENHYVVYKSILSKQDFSDEKIGLLCGLHTNSVQQIRKDFLDNLEKTVTHFKILFSTTIHLDFFENKMNNFSEYDKNIKMHLREQGVSFRLSFCNVLLSNFNEKMNVTGSFSKLFRTKNMVGKKCVALHLLTKDDLAIYKQIIEHLVKLSRNNKIRTLLQYNIDKLNSVNNQYLKDIIQFELMNWYFRLNEVIIEVQLAVDFTKNTVTRSDVQLSGQKEINEIKDFVNVKNHFNTLYNNDLKAAFSENNIHGYTSKFNDSIKRHLYDIGFFNIANKWVRKSYILKFADEAIFDYKRCNFKDLIVEMIKRDPEKYNGQNISFWLDELNKVLEHNYKGVKNIIAINQDERVNINNKNIFLKEDFLLQD